MSSRDDGDVGMESEGEGEDHAGGMGGIVAKGMYGASEARATMRYREHARRRKRAMTRATKERLGRRVVSIEGHGSSYAKAVACSKVRWTEDDLAHRGGRGHAPATIGIGSSVDDSPLPSSRGGRMEQRPRRWLEMDLGECSIELMSGEIPTEIGIAGMGGNGERGKRLLAFRSLEVALMN